LVDIVGVDFVIEEGELPFAINVLGTFPDKSLPLFVPVSTTHGRV
jgi:hypothetical protein